MVSDTVFASKTCPRLDGGILPDNVIHTNKYSLSGENGCSLPAPTVASPLPSAEGVQILRRPAVLARLQICCSTLYEWNNPKSKYHRPDFPKPIRLGGMTRTGAVGWVAAEIDAYLAAIVAQRNADHAEGGKA